MRDRWRSTRRSGGAASLFHFVVDHVALDPTADHWAYVVRLDEAGHRAGDLRLPRPRLAGEEHPMDQRQRIQCEACPRYGAMVERAPLAQAQALGQPCLALDTVELALHDICGGKPVRLKPARRQELSRTVDHLDVWHAGKLRDLVGPSLVPGRGLQPVGHRLRGLHEQRPSLARIELGRAEVGEAGRLEPLPDDRTKLRDEHAAPGGGFDGHDISSDSLVGSLLAAGGTARWRRRTRCGCWHRGTSAAAM